MNVKISKTEKIIKSDAQIILFDDKSDLKKINFSDEEIKYFKNKVSEDKKCFSLNLLDKDLYFIYIKAEKEKHYTDENIRKAAFKINNELNSAKSKKILLINAETDSKNTYSFLEGFLLSNYSFNKYFFKEKDNKTKYVEEVKIFDKTLKTSSLEKLLTIIEGVYIARDLVNEPFNSLNSIDLSKKIKELSNEAGFEAEILNKKQIEALKMGGILAVNKASDIPPTFTIMQWKPEKHKNEKPIIIVGKGIVFDSGGYSLKPGQYMEDMKIDMAGAAATIATLYIVSKLKLPVYLIGFVPSTDNLIGKNGYVPGDIITMHNGMTVEIKNTDAEGRLILADALSYAKKYNPALVIDLATLTGAASRAIGDLACAMMTNADKKVRKTFRKSGNETFERVMEFPLWKEYNDMIKSDIADLKNIGGAEAGHITAAKFLENFTDYPWVHLDIAPNASLDKLSDYRGKGATGIPVRLLINFIENFI